MAKFFSQSVHQVKHEANLHRMNEPERTIEKWSHFNVNEDKNHHRCHPLTKFNNTIQYVNPLHASFSHTGKHARAYWTFHIVSVGNRMNLRLKKRQKRQPVEKGCFSIETIKTVHFFHIDFYLKRLSFVINLNEIGLFIWINQIMEIFVCLIAFRSFLFHPIPFISMKLVCEKKKMFSHYNIPNMPILIHSLSIREK